ncbi:hypothetical protein EW146_g5042 [Bondarzewia mesenterica]|uniref:F-box domain-containing protein n=1 Tax=Bondarzewia mesenterica TaxID=1095465 RepID=A0A4S4LUT5_9AGAM|nr:hypothetical protein EW146_g5042 [Bondarzewia mesenterica]
MPAVTRRQSGKLPAPRIATSSEDVDGDLDSEFMDKDDPLSAQDESQFDSDGAGESFIKATTSMTTKRRKTGKTKSVSKAETIGKGKGPSRRKQGRLENMLGMPLDVLFEIFRCLSPFDLLQLARTSKTLRDLLMSRTVSSLWKNARQSIPGPPAPEPPSDMSEPSWANLLFGGTACFECGTKGIQRVDFALRRRLCKSCLKAGLLYSAKFKSQYPDLDPSILQLIPYTNYSGWNRGRQSNSKYYWRADIEAMTEKVDEFQEDINLKKPEAQRVWEEFQSKSIEHVGAVVENCEPYYDWIHESSNFRNAQSHEISRQRFKDIKARLLAAGFAAQDIDYHGFSYLNLVNKGQPLTEQIWVRIRPKLEAKLALAREDRLNGIRYSEKRQREHKAELLYSQWLIQVLPSQRLYLPCSHQAPFLSCFAEVINKDLLAELPDADWDEPIRGIPQSVADWLCLKRDQCIAMLPTDYKENGGSMLPTLLSDPAAGAMRSGGMDTFAGPLELATSVFKLGFTGFPHYLSSLSWLSSPPTSLTTARMLCAAWSQIGSIRPGSDRLSFDRRGSDAAASLVMLVGLDPSNTVDRTMDRLNRRFICMNCPPKVTGSLLARTWVSCVDHFMFTEFGHIAPKWRLLTPEETAMAKDREQIRHGTVSKWDCNHCVHPQVHSREIVRHLHDVSVSRFFITFAIDLDAIAVP